VYRGLQDHTEDTTDRIAEYVCVGDSFLPDREMLLSIEQIRKSVCFLETIVTLYGDLRLAAFPFVVTTTTPFADRAP
jgi:hypothetical protein